MRRLILNRGPRLEALGDGVDFETEVLERRHADQRLGSILGQGNQNRTPHALQLRVCDGQPPRDDATVRQLDVSLH